MVIGQYYRIDVGALGARTQGAKQCVVFVPVLAFEIGSMQKASRRQREIESHLRTVGSTGITHILQGMAHEPLETQQLLRQETLLPAADRTESGVRCFRAKGRVGYAYRTVSYALNFFIVQMMVDEPADLIQSLLRAGQEILEVNLDIVGTGGTSESAALLHNPFPIQPASDQAVTIFPRESANIAKAAK